MFKSIRSALLFWYALTFILLLGAFGATSYVRLRRSVFKAVDAKLEASALSIAAGLEEMDDGSIDLEIPKALRNLFRRGEDLPYYVVWSREGKILHRSTPSANSSRPTAAGVRSRGAAREVVVAGPLGTWILVGRKAAHEMESLAEFLAASLGAGAAFMALALAGGWFLATRALRPIARISEAALSIGGDDLSRRIDLARTESELGRLAGTLNETFDRLQKAFEKQAQFTADASHELRTPLALVMSQTELALMKDRTPSEYREALLSVDRAAQRMKTVVEGLLTLAHADARQIPLAKDAVDLAAIAAETATLLAPLAERAKVAVSVKGGPARLTGDREKLCDVISNLLSNAIRYTPEGGCVDVAVSAESGAAVMHVVDSGIGIPEKDRPHIFGRFYRVDQARSRDKGGSGLGLAIAKAVVEAHGGTITFTSKEGQGTTFTLRLPGA